MKELWIALGLVALAGCASSPEKAGPYQVPEESARDREAAEELNAQAADVMGHDLARAEELLREALSADLFHGPAHNNLGVVFLKQGKLYEAAHEFEWARKLLPGHPDPRVNLGIVMETAGRTDEALAAFEAALEVYPDYLPAIMGAASLTLQTDPQAEALEGWLAAIALRAEDPRWSEWARARLAAR
jgi:Tfp pilus assembly protein PilF